jgi:hypothetical protein
LQNFEKQNKDDKKRIIKIENLAVQTQTMSLQTLKETLRHCTTQQSQSQPSSSSSSSQSILNDFDTNFPIYRKPPKASLADQLRLFDDPPFQPHNFLSQQNDSKTSQVQLDLEKEEEDEEEEDEDEEPEIKRVKFSSAKSSQFQFDHTGPFEPLVLSSDGEFPLVQVCIISILIVTTIIYLLHFICLIECNY